MLGGVGEGTHNLKVAVRDDQGREAVSTVEVSVTIIEDDAIDNSGSLTISGNELRPIQPTDASCFFFLGWEAGMCSSGSATVEVRVTVIDISGCLTMAGTYM